jgi:hypothetical protein
MHRGWRQQYGQKRSPRAPSSRGSCRDPSPGAYGNYPAFARAHRKSPSAINFDPVVVSPSRVRLPARETEMKLAAVAFHRICSGAVPLVIRVYRVEHSNDEKESIRIDHRRSPNENAAADRSCIPHLLRLQRPGPPDLDSPLQPLRNAFENAGTGFP